MLSHCVEYNSAISIQNRDRMKEINYFFGTTLHGKKNLDGCHFLLFLAVKAIFFFLEIESG